MRGGVTHRALGEIKQRGDEVVIAAVVVVVGWTAGRGGRCSLRLLLVLRLLLRRRLTRVRSHGAVPLRIRPSGFHRLGSLRLVLPKTQMFFQIRHSASQPWSWPASCQRTYLQEEVDQVRVLLEFGTDYAQELDLFVFRGGRQNLAAQADQFLRGEERQWQTAIKKKKRQCGKLAG